MHSPLRRALPFALLSAIAAGGVAGGCSSKTPDGPAPVAVPPGPRPTYGPTVSAPKAPPAIAGGTLLLSRDKLSVYAADPDRDRVSIVKLATRTVSHVALKAGDEPGRSVEDTHGRLHVVLRSAGAIATIDLATSSVWMRRNVCPAPRGIALDTERDLLFVACVGGELVTLPAADGEATQIADLDGDLRDVVINDGHLYVSRFRSATLLEIDPTSGKLLNAQSSPARPMARLATDTIAAVAWRIIPNPKGGVLMVHQRVRDPNAKPVPVGEGGYTSSDPSTQPQPISGGGSAEEPVAPSRPPGFDCDVGIVMSSFTTFRVDGAPPLAHPALSRAVLPVDIAINSVGDVAVVAAGNGKTPTLEQVLVVPTPSEATSFGDCVGRRPIPQPKGQAIAIAAVDANFVVQTREPASIVYYQQATSTPIVIPLATDSYEDTGHSIFHSNAGGFMACASCHPEGGDDGQVWNFEGSGPRRTQNFRGGLSGSEPFHWAGDLHDLSALMGEVFTKRMSGAKLDPGQLAALTRWIDAVPLLPHATKVDAAKIERGRALFNDASTQCASCHLGGKLSNNQTVDVGTGGLFQVPALHGLAFRAPYMHDGCAHNLEERFRPTCGGGDKHGHTSHLGTTQIDDLVAYLKTL